jgi:hypothetical protein
MKFTSEHQVAEKFFNAGRCPAQIRKMQKAGVNAGFFFILMEII